MLSIIREHADSWMIKSILWLIIFAFVGTIFYSWGMGGSSNSAGGVIASVNGEKIFQGIYKFVLLLPIDFVNLMLNLMVNTGRNGKGFCLAIYCTPCFKTS